MFVTLVDFPNTASIMPRQNQMQVSAVDAVSGDSEVTLTITDNNQNANTVTNFKLCCYIL